jgi:hypothetical protein
MLRIKPNCRKLVRGRSNTSPDRSLSLAAKCNRSMLSGCLLLWQAKKVNGSRRQGRVLNSGRQKRVAWVINVEQTWSLAKCQACSLEVGTRFGSRRRATPSLLRKCLLALTRAGTSPAITTGLSCEETFRTLARVIPPNRHDLRPSPSNMFLASPSRAIRRRQQDGIKGETENALYD